MSSQIGSTLNSASAQMAGALSKEQQQFAGASTGAYGDLQGNKNIVGTYGRAASATDPEVAMMFPGYEMPRLVKDPRDDYVRIKKQLVSGTPLGTVATTDDDIAWIKRKEDQVKYDNFLSWVAATVPRGSPAEQEFFQSLFPQFKERAMGFFDEKINLARHLGRLRMIGPKTADDFLLIYLIQNGEINIDPGLATWLASIGTGGPTSSDDIKKGLWNPSHWLMGNTQITKNQAKNMANLLLPYPSLTNTQAKQSWTGAQTGTGPDFALDSTTGINIGKGSTTPWQSSTGSPAPFTNLFSSWTG
jgi:hypothetical protein